MTDDRAIAWVVAVPRITVRETEAADVLYRRRGTTMPGWRVADHVYQLHRPPPAQPTQALATVIKTLRQRLRQQGMVIETVPGEGYRWPREQRVPAVDRLSAA